jgi:hypothetical protein
MIRPRLASAQPAVLRQMPGVFVIAGAPTAVCTGKDIVSSASYGG